MGFCGIFVENWLCRSFPLSTSPFWICQTFFSANIHIFWILIVPITVVPVCWFVSPTGIVNPLAAISLSICSKCFMANSNFTWTVSQSDLWATECLAKNDYGTDMRMRWAEVIWNRYRVCNIVYEIYRLLATILSAHRNNHSVILMKFRVFYINQ